MGRPPRLGLEVIPYIHQSFLEQNRQNGLNILILRSLGQSCSFLKSFLKWGQSKLVDPAEWLRSGLLNGVFGDFMVAKFSGVQTPHIH